jgi:hypothetical protein
VLDAIQTYRYALSEAICPVVPELLADNGTPVNIALVVPEILSNITFAHVSVAVHT